MKPFLALLFFVTTVRGEIAVESPRDYQVFQRATKSRGTVRIAGHAGSACDSAQYRWGATGRWEYLSTGPGCKFDAVATADAGGWYALEIRVLRSGKTVDSATVAHVGVGEVFVLAGQSNATNFGEVRTQPSSGMVVSFDGSNWAPANDPQPGVPDKSVRGSLVPSFGDALFARYKVPVAVASVGFGGTSVRQWLPKGVRFTVEATGKEFVSRVGPGEWESEGGLFDGMMARIGQLGPRGVRAILWHQGESDAFRKPEQQLSTEQYRSLMEKVIRASRERSGWDIPWFVAHVSYWGPDRPGFPPIREAQEALWRSGLAFEGPDTDALTGDYRQNNGKGVHFSASGLLAHGHLWADIISVWLDHTALHD